MRVSHLHIENFKRFESLEVALTPLDCLVGANNSGKTTLLQALALFDFCVHHSLEKTNGMLRLRSRTIAPEDFYVLPVADPLDLWFERRAMQGRKQRRICIKVTFENNDVASVVVKLDYNRFGIQVSTSDNSQAGLTRLLNARMAYLPVFSTFLPREERRLGAAIEGELARGRVNHVIRNLLLELKSKGQLEALTTILQRSFPNLEKLAIEFDEVTDQYIKATFLERNRPKAFDVFAAGSGFQQFLYLFGFILVRQPTVILLDEPDVHLHGAMQRVLLQELQSLVTAGKQVLLATHSRELITRTPVQSILLLEQDTASRLAVAFDIYDTLDRLGSVDPTQLPVIQAYRRVLVVEDRSDRELLAIFGAKLLGVGVWQQVERRLAICFAKGNPWKQRNMPRLREQLQQLITLHGEPLRLFIIADRDYHPDRLALLESLSHPQLDWHVWERAELENYLLVKPALRRIATENNRRRPFKDQALDKEFDRLVEASRPVVNDRLVQAFDEYRRLAGKRWDAATMSRLARQYLEEHWEQKKLELADAKDIVLPGLKRWLRDKGYGQFSNESLARAINPDELPDEMKQVVRRLSHFAGIPG